MCAVGLPWEIRELRTVVVGAMGAAMAVMARRVAQRPMVLEIHIISGCVS